MADRDLIATLAASRPDRSGVTDPAVAVRVALRQLARQYQYLTEEINDLDALLAPLVAQTAPALLALNGVGTDVAGQLLVTAGANPDRITSEAAFAALCGVAPVPASSGRTSRHRLSRGGDRNANAALYMIVLCRLRWDPGTRTYADRRTREGKTKKEIVRCLKRHVAREVYRALPRHALHDRPVAA
jgi:transposase